ncbi:MAG: hypothetical protein WKG03_19140 [Telluria sp.]
MFAREKPLVLVVATAFDWILRIARSAAKAARTASAAIQHFEALIQLGNGQAIVQFFFE